MHGSDKTESHQCAEEGECEPNAPEKGHVSGPLIALTGVVAAAGLRLFLRSLRHPATPPSADARHAAANAAYVREWLSVDPDPLTREEVRSWIFSDGNSPVAKRLSPSARLRFGTAGLRACMGAGYDRMNAYTVICATEAVLKVMREEFADLAEQNGVAIGFDARHNSRKFAVAAAKVFVDAGIPVRLFSRPEPTPLIAFAVLQYKLAASIVITASHNPPEDNGYKLFWNVSDEELASLRSLHDLLLLASQILISFSSFAFSSCFVNVVAL